MFETCNSTYRFVVRVVFLMGEFSSGFGIYRARFSFFFICKQSRGG